jgi:hypothetical protein
LQEAAVVALEVKEGQQKEEAKDKTFASEFRSKLSHAYSRMARRRPPAPLDEKDEEKIPGLELIKLKQKHTKQIKSFQLLICFLIALKKIQLAMNKTSEKQKEVCHVILSRNEKCKTQEEFTRLFSKTTNRKISRQAVMALIDRSSRRICETAGTASVPAAGSVKKEKFLNKIF